MYSHPFVALPSFLGNILAFLFSYQIVCWCRWAMRAHLGLLLKTVLFVKIWRLCRIYFIHMWFFKKFPPRNCVILSQNITIFDYHQAGERYQSVVMSNRENFTIDYRDTIGDQLSINYRNYRNLKIKLKTSEISLVSWPFEHLHTL